MEDAKRAGLTGNVWKAYPKAMLRSRAITAGLKSVGWSGAAGFYDPDEAREFSDTPVRGGVADPSQGVEAPRRKKKVEDAQDLEDAPACAADRKKFFTTLTDMGLDVDKIREGIHTVTGDPSKAKDSSRLTVADLGAITAWAIGESKKPSEEPEDEEVDIAPTPDEENSEESENEDLF